MDRRAFLQSAAGVSAAAAAGSLFIPSARAQQREFAPRPGTWRTFELVTRVELASPQQFH